MQVRPSFEELFKIPEVFFFLWEWGGGAGCRDDEGGSRGAVTLWSLSIHVTQLDLRPV